MEDLRMIMTRQVGDGYVDLSLAQLLKEIHLAARFESSDRHQVVEQALHHADALVGLGRLGLEVSAAPDHMHDELQGDV